MKEPSEAFIYIPPDETIRKIYADIFSLQNPLKVRLIKTIFDKFVSIILLIFSLPMFSCLFLAILIDGIITPENRGRFIFYYYAVSAGKIFKKYKIRVIKEKCIDKELARKGDWHAFMSEWDSVKRTGTGNFIKKYYLDELPQLFNILKGDMSFVGPRPLALHHYEKDLKQGNVIRKIQKAGLVGSCQIIKGTLDAGNPSAEYEYIKTQMDSSSFSIFSNDIVIMAKAVLVVLRGKGL